MLSADADLLGVSQVAVNTKRQNGQVLGLDGAKRGFRFPAWQLDQDAGPMPHFQNCTRFWRVLGPFTTFLLRPTALLTVVPGSTP